MAEQALEIRGLSRYFGGQRALAEVDLTLERGEIHALLGENGAGKSTLIKILAGAVRPDAGEIRVGGAVLPRHRSPADAPAYGLAFVHQDLGLVDDLSVTENLSIELGYERRLGLISFRRSARRAAELLDRVGLEVSPTAVVGSLAQDQKVMVALARAISQGASLVVLDEISASLPAPEMSRLQESLRTSRQAGIAYLYVTHRLEEVFELADRVTVLRDGRRVTTAPVAGLAREELVRWIVGDAIEEPQALVGDQASEPGPVRLRVEDLEGGELSAPFSFEVRGGEIVGLCGLIGSGSREVARILGGATPRTGGQAMLDDRHLPLGDTAAMAGRGCAYVPGDRNRDGVVADLSVRENLFVGRRGKGEDAFCFPRRERARGAALAERFGVRPPGSLERPVSFLSGGNQQKVIFARALRRQPDLLVLDDPTAGVDVGSRVQLHGFVRDCAAAGAAVVLASTDYEEVASQADRVLVMSHGRLVAELAREELTPNRLARASYESHPTQATAEVVK
jgi:ribose transport system ATP-binding protein